MTAGLCCLREKRTLGRDMYRVVGMRRLFERVEREGFVGPPSDEEKAKTIKSLRLRSTRKTFPEKEGNDSRMAVSVSIQKESKIVDTIRGRYQKRRIPGYLPGGGWE